MAVDTEELKDVVQAIKKARMMGGKKFEMVLPEEVAATLEKMRPALDDKLFAAIVKEPLLLWKQWQLISPRRVIKYNINNLSGDSDAVIAGNPQALKRMPEAIKELWDVLHGAEPSARYKEAVERGVFDAGLTVQEIPDIQFLDPFAHLIEQPGLTEPGKFVGSKLYSVWKGLRDYTRFRENWLRYSAYLDYVDRLEGGESIESIGYGASNRKMADEIAADSHKDAAALLSRDLVGDYGDVSYYGQGVRDYAIVFYSWLEVNTRRYFRLIDNAYAQGVGKGFAAAGVIGGIKGARVSAYLTVRMLALYTLIQLWNSLLFGDDEDELSDADRVRLHLNLGRDAEGQIRTIRFQGALSDFLQWFGAEQAVSSMLAVEKGRASYTDVVKSVAKGAPNRLASGANPLFKGMAEYASGLSFWPDAFNPRRIRDQKRHFAKMFGLENEYDWVMDKPSRGYTKSLTGTVVYKRDAGEAAYNQIRGIAYKWSQREKGTSGSSNFTTARSEAIYDWRQAVRFGDADAKTEALSKMRDLEMTNKDIQSAIKRAHPLSSLAIKDRPAFRKTLSLREQGTLDRAIAWYEEVYEGSGEVGYISAVGEMREGYTLFSDARKHDRNDEARAVLASMNDKQAAYIMAQHSGTISPKFSEKMWHPISRAEKMTTTLNGFIDAIRESSHLMPGQARLLEEKLVERIGMEQRNAMIATKLPGYEKLEPGNLEQNMERIRAIHSETAEALDGVTYNMTEPFEVYSGYDELEKYLLQDRDDMLKETGDIDDTINNVIDEVVEEGA